MQQVASKELVSVLGSTLLAKLPRFTASDFAQTAKSLGALGWRPQSEAERETLVAATRDLLPGCSHINIIQLIQANNHWGLGLEQLLTEALDDKMGQRGSPVSPRASARPFPRENKEKSGRCAFFLSGRRSRKGGRRGAGAGGRPPAATGPRTRTRSSCGRWLGHGSDPVTRRPLGSSRVSLRMPSSTSRHWPWMGVAFPLPPVSLFSF